MGVAHLFKIPRGERENNISRTSKHPLETTRKLSDIFKTFPGMPAQIRTASLFVLRVTLETITNCGKTKLSCASGIRRKTKANQRARKANEVKKESIGTRQTATREFQAKADHDFSSA